MKIIAEGEIISNTMYPCVAAVLTGMQNFKIPEFSTAYGYVLEGDLYLTENRVAGSLITNTFFSLPHKKNLTPAVEENFISGGKNTKAVFFIRHGYLGQEVAGVLNEETGRLSYIDGCSDSLLIYPPRQGDPCLNHLHFPAGTNQSYHLHPSVRLGVVTKGQGWSWLKNTRLLLQNGDVFMVEPHEIHRFSTEQGMDVVAFHPDSGWGPTDTNHAMLDRTYILKDQDQ